MSNTNSRSRDPLSRAVDAVIANYQPTICCGNNVVAWNGNTFARENVHNLLKAPLNLTIKLECINPCYCAVARNLDDLTTTFQLDVFDNDLPKEGAKMHQLWQRVLAF